MYRWEIKTIGLNGWPGEGWNGLPNMDYKTLGRIYKGTELIHIGFFIVGMWAEGDLQLKEWDKFING